MAVAYKVRFTSWLMIHGVPLADKALDNPDRVVVLRTCNESVPIGRRKGLFDRAPAKDNLIVEHEAVVLDHVLCMALDNESILIRTPQFFKNTFIGKRRIEDNHWHQVFNGEHIQLGVGFPVLGNDNEMVVFEVQVLGPTGNT